MNKQKPLFLKFLKGIYVNKKTRLHVSKQNDLVSKRKKLNILLQIFFIVTVSGYRYLPILKK
jgi:hypothetical protein